MKKGSSGNPIRESQRLLSERQSSLSGNQTEHFFSLSSIESAPEISTTFFDCLGKFSHLMFKLLLNRHFAEIMIDHRCPRG